MAKTKLILDDTTEEALSLIAMHCPLEVFRLVYLINRSLDLKLARKEVDIDFKHGGSLSFYPLYHFFDDQANIDFYVVANKAMAQSAHVMSQGALFEKEPNYYSTYLVPEHKTVDYFLKIEGADTPKEFLLKLKEIKQITTAYTVDVFALKSYHNLIFN